MSGMPMSDWPEIGGKDEKGEIASTPSLRYE